MSMKKNLVKDWMSTNPKVISINGTLPEAHKIMKDFNVRRLPVLKGDQMVGIVTLGDVREAGPSNATTLTIHELNYLLATLTMTDIMTKDPCVVTDETTLHDAAELMLKEKIGGLPVVVEGSLVGIITESDIFRAVMEIFE